MTIPEMDEQAQRLDTEINRRMVKRAKYDEMIARLQRKVDWQTRRIRELSQQRTLVLNFTLPL